MPTNQEFKLFLIIFIACTIAVCHVCGNSKKDEKKPLSILMSSLPGPGHFLHMLVLGDALKNEGHDVTFIMPQFTDYNYPRELCMNRGLHYIPIPVNISYFEMKNDFNALALSQIQAQSYMGYLLSSIYFSLESFISKEIDVAKVDIAIISDLFVQSFTSNEKMKALQIVSVTPCFSLHSSLLPPWPFPDTILQAMTHDLTISNRLTLTITNFFITPIYQYITSHMTKSSSKCNFSESKYYPIGHKIPLIITTVIGFEYPRTNLPLVNYIGPFIPSKLDPLPSDIDLWLNSKRESSVVYISMGSLFIGSQKLAEALYNGIPSNYSVLWSATNKTILKGIENKLSNDRFLIKSWMPQISALNHPSISLAILHGGAGGVHQALYFGIPIIVIPLYIAGDQHGNAARVQYWKLGIQLDHGTITASTLKESILKIESGPYRSNAEKMSIIMKNAGGVKRAVELIEFYAAVGYDHLVPAYVKYHWSWIQYHNVDVQALLVAIGALMLYLCFKLIKCMCHLCKKQIES